MLGLLFVAALLLSCGKPPAPEVKKMSQPKVSYFDTASDEDYFLPNGSARSAMQDIEDPQPNWIRIRGPQQWDPLRAAEYPLLVGWKTTYPNSNPFYPFRHGHVLVLNRESGELFVIKAWEIHKLMLPSQPIAAAADSQPQAEEPRAITSVDWVMLPKRLTEVSPSVLEIRFLSGSDLVGPVLVRTGQAKPAGQKQRPSPALGVQPTPTEQVNLLFERHSGRTGFRGPGVELRAEAENSTWHARKFRWPLLGTIQIPKTSVAPQAQWIDAQLVFTYKSSAYVERLSLHIPIAAFEKEGESLKGQFILDMHPLFEVRKGEDVWVPRNLQVLVVCAGQLFGPYPVDMSGFAVPANQQGH